MPISVEKGYKKNVNRIATVTNTKILMGKILYLRKHGYTYQKIAETLNISYPYAQRLYVLAIKRLVKEPAEQMLKLELARLDELLVPAMTAATMIDSHGNPIFNKEATDTVLRLMERRAKYLGLDTPVKTENKHTINQKSAVTIYLPSNNREKPAIENGEAYYPTSTFPKSEDVRQRTPVIEVSADELERFSESGDFIYGVDDE